MSSSRRNTGGVTCRSVTYACSDPRQQKQGEVKVSKSDLDNWYHYETTDLVRWSRIIIRSNSHHWAQNLNSPVLVEFGIFNFLTRNGQFRTAIPCDLIGKTAVLSVLDNFPIKRNWIIIPVDLMFDKEYQNRELNAVQKVESTAAPAEDLVGGQKVVGPFVNLCLAFVVDNLKGVSYFFDSPTDLELLTIESEKKGGLPLPPPGSRQLHNLISKHDRRLAKLDKVRNSILLRLISMGCIKSLAEVPSIGRLFLRSEIGGCGLVLMKSVELLLSGQHRPSNKADMEALQKLWRTLPTSSNFWDPVKLELGRLTLEREATQAKYYERHYKVGQTTMSFIEPVVIPLD